MVMAVKFMSKSKFLTLDISLLLNSYLVQVECGQFLHLPRLGN
jgi:hypothetical protein